MCMCVYVYVYVCMCMCMCVCHIYIYFTPLFDTAIRNMSNFSIDVVVFFKQFCGNILQISGY